MDENKKKALAAALMQIEKQHGKGSVMKMGDVDISKDIEVVSTGSLSLDIALGCGGLPRGRIIEIYGPESSGKTTLTLQVIAEVQKLGGTAAFIDAEHALDINYAGKLGVDIENLYVSQPDTGEQALEITDSLVRSGALDIVVIDSVAALTPKAEIEGDMGDSHMGLQARLMSQALRKLTANIKRSNTMVIFINQIRMKIGVMFGCFHYDTRVVLADGSSKKIGKIVNQKLPVEVMSYNQQTAKFESRKVVNWFDNGKTEEFLQFKVLTANKKNGSHQFACTPNHLLLTPSGYRPAGDLELGDEVMTQVEFYDSPILEQIILGSILGDGSLRKASNYKTQLRIGHGKAQDDYCQWKKSLFAEHDLVGYSGTNSRDGHSFDTIPLYQLTEVLAKNYAYRDDKRIKSPSYESIAKLEPLAIAIWYMDDGTFDSERQNRCSICCAGMPEEKRQALVEWFAQHGMTTTLVLDGRINFNIEATKILHNMIAPFVHPSMDYKLLPEMRGLFKPLAITVEKVSRAIPMPIIEIYSKPPSKKTHRFDLEIEGNHNYLVDGVIVHNSPETTTGGNALKFYASVRLDIRRIGAVKKGDDIIGNETRVKVVKNKVAPPFKQAEFEILYGEGISFVGELVDLGVNFGFVQKAGSWYSYGSEKIGQGKENAKLYFKENPKKAKELEVQIRDEAFKKPLLAVKEFEPTDDELDIDEPL
jgi:recombination protein RecA